MSGSVRLFPHDRRCVLVLAQAQEHRLAQLAVAGPFAEFDLADEAGPDPVALLHFARREAASVTAPCVFREVVERAGAAVQRLQGTMETSQEGFTEPGANFPCELQMA